jgi:hypothetical protein
VGRADRFASHWKTAHPTAPFPRNHNWPRLQQVVSEYRIVLSPAITKDPSAPPGPSTLAGPPRTQAVDYERAQAGHFMMPPPLPFQFDPRYAPAQGYNPSYSAHIVHQYITPLHPPPFNGSYPPPGQYQRPHPMHNNRFDYGQERRNPQPFTGPSTHSPGPSQYSQYSDSSNNHQGTSNYYPRTPGYSDAEASPPIGGAYTRSFNLEYENQGSSTNPHSGNAKKRRRDWSPYADDVYQEF